MKYFYTVYKTTNLINNKYYIGVHKTLDPNDEYLGSGHNLKLAIVKYGKENFKKEILFIFDNEQDMFNKEKELVNIKQVVVQECYNMKTGGTGSTTHLNHTVDNAIKKQWSSKGGKSVFDKHGISDSFRTAGIKTRFGANNNNSIHKEKITEGRRLMRLDPIRMQKWSENSSKNNNMRGKFWITKEGEKKKPVYLKEYETIYKPLGWLSAKDKQNNFKTRWINDGKVNTIVTSDEAPKYINEGWVFGRLNAAK